MGFDRKIVLQNPNPDFDDEERAAAMRSRIGAGTTTVLATDDCRGTIEALRDRGVTNVSDPEEGPWVVQVNVEDCYGNHDNLVEADYTGRRNVR